MPSRFALAALLAGLPLALSTSCGGGDGRSGGSDQDAGGGDSGPPAPDAYFPPAPVSDPCLVAGYHFDEASDCDEVRCPELACECPSLDARTPGEPEPPKERVEFSACAPGRGCLTRADCARVCEPSLRLVRAACDQRIAAAGSRSCSTDDDCVVGRCREESIGRLCVDAMPCAEAGHCGEGFACLFDPGTLDPETSFPTSLGTCADGGSESTCYDDGDCRYGRCSGQRCTGGLEGDSCQFDSSCASGLCRVEPSAGASGYCVTGERGGSCADDGDCGADLHCVDGRCYSGDVGQTCDNDRQCTSGICVLRACRGGEPGSFCEDDADCREGVCASSRCASGGLLSPCAEPEDCGSGLRCARQVCTDGSKDSPCYTVDDCDVLACVNGACSDGALGVPCEQDGECQSGRCANPAGVESGVCTTGGRGSRCYYGAHCLSGVCAADGTCS